MDGLKWRLPLGFRPSRDVQEVLPPFLGQVAQQPPDYSALKVKGRRAYDLARAGQAVELTPRMVRIDRLVVLRYDWPLLELEIDCGSGTYIRSIARDVGEALGCGGYVETLIRTRIGPFTLDQAVDPFDAIDGLDRSTHAVSAGCHPGSASGYARSCSGRSRDPGSKTPGFEDLRDASHPRGPSRDARPRSAISSHSPNTTRG